MKKFFSLLVFAGLFACWSCNLNDTYTQTNVTDMVTVQGGELVNDYGYTLNVVEDAVGADKWRIEGARYLALYDILNRQLDIRLKEVLRAAIVEPDEYSEQEEYAEDPVELLVQGFSGNYLNVGFTITRAKGSNNAHIIRFYYKVESNILTLYVVHDGYGEDIVHMDEDLLEAENRMFTLSLNDLPYFSSVVLAMNCIVTEGGDKVIKPVTVNLR